jgi:hypothetical protein
MKTDEIPKLIRFVDGISTSVVFLLYFEFLFDCPTEPSPDQVSNS